MELNKVFEFAVVLAWEDLMKAKRHARYGLSTDVNLEPPWII